MWFVKTRGSYLPSSWQGWLLYVPFIGYLVLSYLSAFRQSDNLINFILFLMPQWVAATVVMTWIATVKSK